MNEKQTRSCSGEARKGQEKDTHERGAQGKGRSDVERSKETLAQELNLPMPMGRKFINRIGSTFGRLTVLNYAGMQGAQHRWMCVCECGSIKPIQGGALANGTTQSCGCMRAAKTGLVNSTHRMTGTSIYKTWSSMRERCLHPKHKSYMRYGGRGITICERWNDFSLFLEDMGPRPSKAHSIERNNNDGPYCKENCRWATFVEQSNNKSNNRLLTYNGETLTLANWSKRRNLKQRTLFQRLERGWSIEKSLTTPLRTH